MRRALFIAVLALLFADASGISALLIPETCSVSESGPGSDSGCPAFCARCNCGCCASSLVHKAPVDVAAELRVPGKVAIPTPDRQPAGVSLDILHVPKPLLT